MDGLARSTFATLVEAPGAPGGTSTWTSSAKDMVTTALGVSRVWVTLGHGILNEVYWPATGVPQIRDLGFIVTGPFGWVEVKRALRYRINWPRHYIPLPQVVHEGDGYRLEIEVVPDPVMGLPLPAGAVEPAVGAAETPPVIGVSLRRWREDGADMARAAEALVALSKRRPVRLRFLPFHTPADKVTSEQVMERLSGRLGEGSSAELANPGDDPQAMLLEVSNCDALLGMRLHALIYAANQQIPVQYLGQIMVLLKRGHLVNAARGPSGGYILARPPETISVKEILSVLEGPEGGFEFKTQMHGRSISRVTQRLAETWARGIRAMETMLDETTLADLCKPEAPALMYYI